jgi:hypothetical protein
VLVGPSGPAAWSSWWPELELAAASAPSPALLLDASATLRAAADQLAQAVKGELRLDAARPVYGTRGPGSAALVPAWQYTGRDGASVVVDAVTGEILL